MNAKMDENLTYEDIGHVLDGKADKLIDGSEDPEQVIREVMETIARAESVRSREKTVDQTGRVSFGRDLTGTYGLAVFQQDPDERARQTEDEDVDDSGGN